MGVNTHLPPPPGPQPSLKNYEEYTHQLFLFLTFSSQVSVEVSCASLHSYRVSLISGRASSTFTLKYTGCLSNKKYLIYCLPKPATVAQHVEHPLVIGKVTGSNLGPTPSHN